MHVLVRVCRRINASMNLSVRACACPFLTWSLLHFEMGGANDPWLTRSPAERGRVGRGGLSLRARQCRTQSLAVRARHVGVGVSPACEHGAFDSCVRTRAPGGPRGERPTLSCCVYAWCPVGEEAVWDGREVIQRSSAAERRDRRKPAGASYFYFS